MPSLTTAHPADRRGLQLIVAGLCAIVALLAGITSGLGVFARGDGAFVTVTSARGEAYEMATTGIYAWNALAVVAEGVGWDLFTLLVAVPAMLVAALLIVRGSYRGHLFAAGMFGYFIYLSLEYAVTWAFGPLFIGFVTILALSLIGLALAWSELNGMGLADRFDQGFPRRAWAALSLGMSALLVVMWAGRITAALGASGAPELHGETTMTIQALDLGLLVPLSVLIAVASWRRVPAGMAGAAAFAVTFVAMSAAIVSMMISASIVTGTLQAVPIVVFGLAALAGAVLAVRMYASIDSTPHQITLGRARPAGLPAAG